MSVSKIVDVSGWQSADLSGLRADPEIRGVIVKFTEGTSTASGSKAHSQAATAAASGLMVLGGYDFARPGSGAAEASVLADAVAGTPVHVLVIDAEVPGIDAVHVVDFAQTVAARGYGRALLYGSTSYIESMYAGNMAVKQWLDLWVAEYHRCFCVDVYPRCPDPFNEYVGWQFTDREPVLGEVDCSVFDDNYLGGAFANAPIVDTRSGVDMLIRDKSNGNIWLIGCGHAFHIPAAGADERIARLEFEGVRNAGDQEPLFVVQAMQDRDAWDYATNQPK